MFCTKCGAKIPEGTRFCTSCGTPVGANAAPVSSSAQTVTLTGRNLRFRCPSCGRVVNAVDGAACEGCGNTLSAAGMGYVKVYRMGNFMGVAAGMGIYVDEVPMGHIGNKEVVMIPLAPGSHKIHITLGMNRKCNDPIVNVQAGRVLCFKVHQEMGFVQNTMVLEQVSPDSMPE